MTAMAPMTAAPPMTSLSSSAPFHHSAHVHSMKTSVRSTPIQKPVQYAQYTSVSRNCDRTAIAMRIGAKIAESTTT